MVKNDRSKNGRFAHGNSGGPGRPPRHVEVEYVVSMLSVCTITEWQEIVRAAVNAAKNGDHKAREWLASYVIGQLDGKSATFTALDKKATLGRFDTF